MNLLSVQNEEGNVQFTPVIRLVLAHWDVVCGIPMVSKENATHPHTQSYEPHLQ